MQWFSFLLQATYSNHNDLLGWSFLKFICKIKDVHFIANNDFQISIMINNYIIQIVLLVTYTKN